MPFPVKNLIEGHPDPVTVTREDPVTKALNLMLKHDYSQLPVIDLDGHPLGMITYEGIIRGIKNFKIQLEYLRVRDVMVGVTIFYMEQDLFELLEALKNTNAVLIVDPGSMLAGIVTSYDSTEYFRNRAENLMLVEDIEVTIKYFILLAYTNSDDIRDDSKLTQAIVHVTPKDDTVVKPPKMFDELTLGQYISLLTLKSTWSFFDPLFQIQRDALINLLNAVRETRNDLAHFRSEITAEQADQLHFCANWLADRWEDYQAMKTQELVKNFLNQHKQFDARVTMVSDDQVENKIPSGMRTDEPKADVDIPMIAEESRPQESRYAPLIDYLQSQSGSVDEVKLSFEGIEQIIGGELPASAYNHRAWWANDAVGHPHSQLWVEAGWRTTYVNLKQKIIPFARIREREKAYINFFSKLLSELRKQDDFPLRRVSTDGTSWVVCQTLAPTGPSVGQFNYSFTRGRQFRVELYLDAFEQKPTKEIYDRICSQREQIERVLGKLSWERIDDKRASRIALYHPGWITDSKEQLAALREWAVPAMITFYKTLEPIATQAILEVLKRD